MQILIPQRGVPFGPQARVKKITFRFAPDGTLLEIAIDYW
jgi:hypothetical protein